jgi:peptidyl-prolyl cis-trans isomerase D
MLSKLRDYSSYFLWFLIISFVGFMAFSGVQECGSGPAQRGIVAEINGQPITLAAYSNAISRAQQNRQEKGEELTDEQMSQLREQTWQQLIGALIIEQETSRRNINVTDEELAMFLRQYPPDELQQNEAFQIEGKFDYQRYLQAMSNTTPEYTQFWKSVESYWRPQLRQSKLQQQIISAVRVSDAEVREQYHTFNDAARVEFLLITSSPYNKQVGTPTDDSLQAIYEQEQSRYKRDDRVKMDIVMWNKQPSAADRAWVHDQILEVKKQLDAGAEFATMAEQYSMDGTASNGGDLGWFGKGAMVKPFEDAAYALQPGQVSAPVETQFGWHLIKLDETRASEAKEGETELRARHILIRPEISQQTTDSIMRAADDYAIAVREGGIAVSDTTAKAVGGRFLATGYVQRGENIPVVGTVPGLKTWAFTAEIGSVSEPTDEAGKIMVAKLVERREKGVAPFEEVRTQVQTRYTNIKARDLAKVQADSLSRLFHAGTPLKDLSTGTTNVTYTLTELFTRSITVPNVGKSPLFMGAAFNLTYENPKSEPVVVDNGWAIISLVEKQVADEAAMTGIRDSVAGTVLRAKQNDVFTRWFTELYENADIRDYRGQVFGSSL